MIALAKRFALSLALVVAGAPFNVGSTALATTPLQINEVSVGEGHACAVVSDNTLSCWGWNEDGQVGNGTTIDRVSPQGIGSEIVWSSVSAGRQHTCGISVSLSLYCWGDNQGPETFGAQVGSGQLGLGDVTDRVVPTRVGTRTDWASVSSGYFHTCAITSAGAMYCWGQNLQNAVGDGTQSARLSPVQVGSAMNWRSVSSGDDFTCGVSTLNALYCWGFNYFGQLGTGDTANRSVPTRIASTVEWSQVSAGANHVCGLAVGGSLYCWGWGLYGQLGGGTRPEEITSPTQVGTRTDWAWVSAGGSHTCGMTNSGSAYCWGYNASGQVGSGEIAEVISAPVLVSGGLTWASIGVGGYASCAVSSNAKLFCWGPDAIANQGVATGSSQRAPLQVLPLADGQQNITFSAIANRTTGQALTFTVAPTASSGLTVSLSASGACEVSGFMVSVLDKGTCTLTATQEGDETWTPAEPVIRSFTISRVLLSNKTVTFLQWDGKPAVGIGVNWRTPDGTYRSNYQPLYLCTTKSKCPVTNSKGQITFAKIPGGAITFEVTGKIGAWSTSVEATDGSQIKRVTVGSAATNVYIGPTEGDQPVLVRVRVTLPSGAPVPGAEVEYGFRQYQFAREDAQCFDAGKSWNLSTCIWRATTNSEGIATLRLPAGNATYQGGVAGFGQVHARFTDDILSQRSAAVNLTENGAEIVLEDLPVVDIELESSTVNLGAATALSAIALDEGGLPIQGQKLTLKSSVAGATKSCTGAKTVATTNSAGRAIFKVCPIKTATWTVDGKAIVGSGGVKLTVQLTPTAPRTLVATAKTRSVSLAWVVPVKANASAVTDYIVQYRLQGATTWITFRDGTSTARKATVTGLASGQVYEFRIAAKNRSGTGSWSDVVLGTPN